MTYRTALIVGTGPGLSASLARLFAARGLAVALAARNTDKLGQLAAQTGASLHACDATDAVKVSGLFDAVEAKNGAPDVVVFKSIARAHRRLVTTYAQAGNRASHNPAAVVSLH